MTSATDDTTEDVFARPTQPPAGGTGAYSVDGKPDQYGRYRLPHLDSGRPTPWTRVSTWAKSISDTYTLSQWGARMAVWGVVHDEGLLALAQSSRVEDKNTLNDIVERGKDVAGAKTAASLGTALHAFTEQQDAGELEPGKAPARWRPHLAAYAAALAEAGLEVVPGLIERINVCGPYQLAGRWDRVLRTTREYPTDVIDGATGELIVLPAGTLIIGDLKSGRDLSYGWPEIAIQLAVYAHATKVWDEVARQYEDPPVLDTRVAVVMHLPALADPADVRCDLYDVDIAAGWAAVALCGDVRAWRKRRGLAVPRQLARGATVTEAVALDAGTAPVTVVSEPSDVDRVRAARTAADLSALWRELHPVGRWTPELHALGAARHAEILADTAAG